LLKNSVFVLVLLIFSSFENLLSVVMDELWDVGVLTIDEQLRDKNEDP